MKWFKHMTDMSEDEFIAELEQIYGLEGYARWNKLLEAIAKQMDKTNKHSVAYPWPKWSSILRGKQNKLRSFLVHLENQRKIKLNENGNVLEISCRKLLDLRDEYSRKSGQTPDTCPDNVAPEVDTDTEVHIDKEKKEKSKRKKKPFYGDEFLTFWEQYPNKTGKGKACESWKKIKAPKPKLQEVLDAVALQCKSQKWIEGYIPNPATWINQRRWEDEVFEQRGESYGIY